MKIWITRDVTGSIHAGGLERLYVWFAKPKFFYAANSYNELDDLPFGNEPGKGLGRFGWAVDHYSCGVPHESISFAKLFGYGDNIYHNGYVPGLSHYVWGKLCEHYGNTEFVIGWYEYENAGKCKQEDFLLEIDLSITSFK